MSRKSRSISQGYSKLIGEPYEKYNCWQIAKEFYRIVYGIELLHAFDNFPEDKEEIKHLIYSNMGSFEKVDTPQFGDIILLKIRGIESHIAVYLEKGMFIHTSKGTGCVLDRVSVWGKVIVGFYRLKG